MRARDYAVYYLNLHKDQAESFVEAEYEGLGWLGYRAMLGRYIRRELRRLRAAPPSKPAGRRRRRRR